MADLIGHVQNLYTQKNYNWLIFFPSCNQIFLSILVSKGKKLTNCLI